MERGSMKQQLKYEAMFKLSESTYWCYDTGTAYQDEFWNEYSGPYFAKGDYLRLLHNEAGTVVLHCIDSRPTELWRGQLYNESDFQDLVVQVEQYRRRYCAEHGIDCTRNIEHDLVCMQNGRELSYMRLVNIPDIE